MFITSKNSTKLSNLYETFKNKIVLNMTARPYFAITQYRFYESFMDARGVNKEDYNRSIQNGLIIKDMTFLEVG